ncbi:MAG TPA: hypothetical protein VMP08_26880 [Anaerolineae bacterium]|nr:hypothetical protein [Anaerolineae bacterium]
MYISQEVIGLSCLIGALILTFAWPLGRRSNGHVFLSLCIIVLFILAAWNLIPVTWVSKSDSGLVILIGLGAGLLAVIYRDVRRFLRFFHGKVYRMTHPYYWYGRYYRRRRRY